MALWGIIEIARDAVFFTFEQKKIRASKLMLSLPLICWYGNGNESEKYKADASNDGVYNLAPSPRRIINKAT